VEGDAKVGPSEVGRERRARDVVVQRREDARVDVAAALRARVCEGSEEGREKEKGGRGKG
jgi:hypothetical protein